MSKRRAVRGISARAWFYNQPGFHGRIAVVRNEPDGPTACAKCGERHEVADGYECGAECPLCGFELWTMKPGDVHRHEID